MSERPSFQARIVLRPRSTDETFDLALAYLRRHTRDFLGPILIVSTSVMAIVVGLLILGVSWGPATCIAILLLGISERIITAYAGSHLFANNPSVWRATQQSVLCAPVALLSTVAGSLPLFVILFSSMENEGAVALGVTLAMIWPFILTPHLYVREVFHLEELGLRGAVRRGRALTSYRYGRALIVLMVGFLVRGLFVLAVHSGVVFVLEFMLQFSDVTSTIGYAPALLGLALSGPYDAMVRLFDYIDARTRREGWDIQVRFNAIEQEARRDRTTGQAA